MCRAGKVFALLPTMGGQTALNTALSLRKIGALERYNIELIGATADAIDKAEDRERFKQAMIEDRPGSAQGHHPEGPAAPEEGLRRQLPLSTAATIP